MFPCSRCVRIFFLHENGSSFTRPRTPSLCCDAATAHELRYIDQTLSWADAEEYCRVRGGSLPSIHSRRRSYQIFNLGRDAGGVENFWIGGNSLNTADEVGVCFNIVDVACFVVHLPVARSVFTLCFGCLSHKDVGCCLLGACSSTLLLGFSLKLHRVKDPTKTKQETTCDAQRPDTLRFYSLKFRELYTSNFAQNAAHDKHSNKPAGQMNTLLLHPPFKDYEYVTNRQARDKKNFHLVLVSLHQKIKCLKLPPFSKKGIFSSKTTPAEAIVGGCGEGGIV